MRVWLLTSEIPQEIAGGIARYVDSWARILGAAGHEVTVITQTENACDRRVAPGVRLIGVVPRESLLNEPNPQGLPDTHPAYPYNIFAHWPALSYQMADEVLALLRRLPPPDLIESQEYAALPYFLLQRKLTERGPLEKISLLVHIHSPSFALALPNQELRYRFPEYWVGQMEKFCIVAADALHAPTAFPVRSLERTLRRSLNATIVPHPLLTWREFAPQRARARQLVFVGRMQALKGVLPLVKACSRLWGAGEDFQLTLVGPDLDFFPKGLTVGEFLMQRYRRWIDDGHLRLVGKIDNEAALEYMQQAWAVVIPSLWESCSYVCMEAMGVGQVVLASRSGGQAELIGSDGNCGFLFDWQVPGDYERQLERVLSLTPTEHQHIAQQARERIRALCDPQAVLAQRLQHYTSLLSRPPSCIHFPTAHTGLKIKSPYSQLVSNEKHEAPEPSPILSVVVPFYNLGNYLPETLQSIFAATVIPQEIIIVNDGSTDPHSLAALHEIEARRLPQVRVLHTENQGLALSRIAGAAAAKGEFIAFVDADDLVEPEFFERALVVLQRYTNVSMVCSWLRYFGEATDLWPTWNAEFPYLLGHNKVFKKALRISGRVDT